MDSTKPLHGSSCRRVVRRFATRGEAEVAREMLVANGIDAVVASDDCGSVDPSLAFARDVLLLVGPRDEKLARAALEECEAESSVPDGD